MLRELYQELILDHGTRPRNFKVLDNPSKIKEGFNPLCGDRLTLYLNIDNQTINEMAFQGQGCAISMASTSLMIESLKGKSIATAKEVFQLFHDMITKFDSEKDYSNLDKLEVLKGVAEFPARVKCASLAWHTLIAALENNEAPITTE